MSNTLEDQQQHTKANVHSTTSADKRHLVSPSYKLHEDE